MSAERLLLLCCHAHELARRLARNRAVLLHVRGLGFLVTIARGYPRARQELSMVECFIGSKAPFLLVLRRSQCAFRCCACRGRGRIVLQLGLVSMLRAGKLL
jgi:hypothetical protein